MQILALCSRFAEFAGWLCQDAGDVLEAERLTDRALPYRFMENTRGGITSPIGSMGPCRNRRPPAGDCGSA